MLRRAPDLVKKIYGKRGSIPYIGVGSAPQPETNFDQKPGIQQTTDLAIEGAIEDRGPELPQIPHGGGPGETHPAAYAGSSQRRKVLAELSRGSRGGVWPIPEALSILNVNDNSIPVKEAMKPQLSVIGIVDPDTNPFGIQYPIPGNDDPVESLAVHTNPLHNAIADAKENELTKICSS